MENTTSTQPTPDPVLDPVVDPVPNGTPVATAPRRRFELRRSRTDRMLGGVCGGLAESLGADPALVRLGLVALTVLGAGSGALLYVAAWILVPEKD